MVGLVQQSCDMPSMFNNRSYRLHQLVQVVTVLDAAADLDAREPLRTLA